MATALQRLDVLCRRRMTARRPFSMYDVQKATYHVLGALAHLHGLGIVHNDLQCKNIWITDSGHRVVLGDFDRSRIADEVVEGHHRRILWTDDQWTIRARDIYNVGSNVT